MSLQLHNVKSRKEEKKNMLKTEQERELYWHIPYLN